MIKKLLALFGLGLAGLGWSRGCKMFRQFVVSIIAVAATVGVAQAGVIQVDNLLPKPTSGSSANRINIDEVGVQTFTVLDAGFLETVELQIYRNSATADLIVSIIETVGGAPVLGATPVATRIVPIGTISNIASSGGVLAVDFSIDAIAVTAAQMLGILLSSSGDSFAGYTWLVSSNGIVQQYSGGDAFLSQNGGPFQTFTRFDYGFRVAVTPSTVPIPPALWLFGSGLLGLIGVARKKTA
jgi:hypothetical protein